MPVLTSTRTPTVTLGRGAPKPSKGGLSLDLTEQLAFYGAYHNNWLNQLIHFVCVPAIVWSLCVWVAAAGPLASPDLVAPLTAAIKPHLPPALPPVWADALLLPNGAYLGMAAYSVFYLLLDFFAGLSWTLFVGLPIAWTATAFVLAPPAAVTAHMAPWAFALAVHVAGWYLQIHPGHAICEKRKPALLDSLLQAFSLAPLFVWFELLFLLGYRPALRERVQRRVNDKLLEFRRASAKSAKQ